MDVNPFLVWLGNAKAASYPAALLAETRASVPVVTGHAATWCRRSLPAVGPQPAQHRPVVGAGFAGGAQGTAPCA